MPDLNWTQLKFVLIKHGWRQVRQEGSHTIWKKGERVERIAVGHGHSMGGGGLKEVLKRFEIKMSDVTEPSKIKRRGGKRIVAVPPEGTFARRLYDSRTKLGLSQAGAAKLAQLHQTMLSSWERNESNPFNGKILPKTKQGLLLLAEKFGWEDLLVTIKSAEEQIVTKARGDIPTGVAVEKGTGGKKPPIAISKHTQDVEKKKGQTEAVIPETETAKPTVKPTSNQKEFVHLITADDIWIWGQELENKITKLEIELKKAYTEDIVELKRKARLYDEMKEKFGKFFD